MRLFKLWAIFVLFSMINASIAQDSLSTVVFFRQGRLIGTKTYEVLHDKKVIGVVAPDTYFSYRCQPGLAIFKVITASESSFNMTLEPAKTYYLECGVGKGTLDGLATFRQVTAAEAQLKVSKFDSRVEFLSSEVKGLTEGRKDTIEALKKMFIAKKRSGRIISLVFGAAALYSIGDITLTPDEKLVRSTLPNGTQVSTIVSVSPPASTYVIAGISVLGSVAGLYKLSRYSDKQLAQLIDRYSRGESLGVDIRKKLKPRFFTTVP